MPDVKLCECGCGGPTPIARQADRVRGHVKGQPCRFIAGHNQKGAVRVSLYAVRYAPDHPNAQNGAVYQHVLIAEAALGRYMPAGAEIHHVDGNSLNNANSNLVICQDKAYHKLLHVRTRIVRAGGDPDTEKVCGACLLPKPLGAFDKMKANLATGRQSRCRECARAHDAAIKRNRNVKKAA